MKTKIGVLFITLMFALVLSACGNGSDEAKELLNENKNTEAKDGLKIAISVDPDGLDPHRTTASSTFVITNNIYDTLVKVTKDGEIEPSLAASYEQSEDGKTLTFNLREDVQFHDGTALTAKDVAYSFERIKDELGPRKDNYAYITEVNVIDDYTIEFKAESPSASFISDFAYPWAAIVKDGADETLKKDPVGTGPYKLVNWTPQDKIVLEGVDHYNEGQIQNVEFKMMPDSTAQVTSFKKGDIHLIETTGDVVDTLGDATIIEIDNNSVQLMAMNLENDYLSNKKLRQAINMAVDKEELINAVWWGYGKQIGSHYPPVLKGYVDTTGTYPYDVKKAKALVEESGAKGITLNMKLPSDYPNYVAAGQIIAEKLEAIGIHVKIETIEWGTWLTDVYGNRDYDLTVVGHTGRIEGYDLLEKYNSTRSDNYFNYKNTEIDDLLSSIKVELDEERRMDMYEQVQTILAEEVPALYIQEPTRIYGISDDLEGFSAYPIDVFELKDLKFKE
ncbi:ABC transporter substrate-binding protein [Phocicoccus pinnipedialis]|uniref:Periplasmic dipeptide transport protein n=1 Tax=Phocicoccus pinnipedialis TaxID=110845 RepID=A0A6V7R4J1_9BACL|nr:ABC transporter substrate-binding protein [Jeotgalicoccus pinnipedialis]MBP1939678.1 peptide/nickel transport system substrate-binding protein [Jeotgalicoccus pinnipedialis]CAD2072300.1 Periplasmic dipeptide transport protein precursor [Jeotgalicoccus pinnipedialis]